MSRIQSFVPQADRDARILILGSMPGKASLEQQQYYAHPRNAFWPILSSLFGFDANADYVQRIACLKAAKIGLWDVLASCERNSSLDADIVEASLVPNDLGAFLESHYQIKKIFFNGATAERLFRLYLQSALDNSLAGLSLQRLPSTSPAHASMSFEQKLECWKIIAEQ